MFCQNCGTKLHDGSRFCPNCGAQVIIPQTVAAPEPEVSEPQVQSTQNVPPVSAQPEPQSQNTQSESEQFNDHPELWGETTVLDRTQLNTNPKPQTQNPQPEPEYQYAQPEYQNEIPVQQETQPKKKSKKGLIIGLIAGGVVLLAAIVAVLLLVVLPFIKDRQKIAIDFTKYAEVEFSGYDSLGTAEAKFNEKQFLADYGEQIKYSREYKSRTDDPSETIMSYFYYYLDDYYYDLSNGDEVKYMLSVYPDISDIYNVEIADADRYQEDGTIEIPFTVTGLKEGETFDPFDGIQISVDGMDPFGELTVDWSSCPQPTQDCYYAFDIDKLYDDLANGDVVTIALDEWYADGYFLEEYGMIPSRTSYEYVVEGLPTLLSSLSQLTDADKSALSTACDKYYQAQYIDTDAETITTNSFGMIGTILKLSKDPSKYSSSNNRLYVIYEQNCTVSAEGSTSEDFTSYAALYFENVSIENGALVFDPDECDSEYNQYKIEVGNWTISGNWGYATLDDLKADIIDNSDPNYTYESSFTK